MFTKLTDRLQENFLSDCSGHVLLVKLSCPWPICPEAIFFSLYGFV